MLTPEQRAAYEEIADLNSMCSELFNISMYECGFRDGAAVMLDVLAPNRSSG